MNFPVVERPVLKATVSHFLLMFGYKTFSSYFPLFLISLGFSSVKVGYTYLLIYLSFVIFSPIAAYLLHRFSPALISSFGIAGYGIYSLGLLIFKGAGFDVLQVILGASAALFFVSSRLLVANANSKAKASEFGLFYSAPLYAEALAPVVGAGLLYLWGFNGIFAVSFFIHIANVLFNSSFRDGYSAVKQRITLLASLKRFFGIFKTIYKSNIFSVVGLSFLLLVIEGFYSAFFILFLKDLGFVQNQILFYVSGLSLVGIPVSWVAIKFLGRYSHKRNMFGLLLYGAATMAIAVLFPFVGLTGILGLNIIKSLGGFMSNSHRSAMISEHFNHKRHEVSEESAAADSVFSPLGTAIGAVSGGFLIIYFGYSGLFLFGGVLITTLALIILLSKGLRAKPVNVAGE